MGGTLPTRSRGEGNLRETDKDSPVYVSLLGPAGHEHAGLAAVNMAWAPRVRAHQAGLSISSAPPASSGDRRTSTGSRLTPHPQEMERRGGATTWHHPPPHDVAQLAVARLAEYCRSNGPTEAGRVSAYFVYHLDERALGEALNAENEQ